MYILYYPMVMSSIIITCCLKLGAWSLELGALKPLGALIVYAIRAYKGFGILTTQPRSSGSKNIFLDPFISNLLRCCKLDPRTIGLNVDIIAHSINSSRLKFYLTTINAESKIVFTPLIRSNCFTTIITFIM